MAQPRRAHETAPAWTVSDIPDQHGRIAAVTGATSGTGKEIARELARAGAHVVMLCRNPSKAAGVRRELARDVDEELLDVVRIDLADLASVRAGAAEINERWPALDLLINNAGIMHVPHAVTADGFESQLASNYLGHVALTGLVLPGMLDKPGSRVVTMSSIAHRGGRIHLDDLMFEHRYNRFAAYGQSKLACLMFAYTLDKRLCAAGAQTRSLAAHPGVSATNLGDQAPMAERLFFRHGGRLLNTALQGALAPLRAATDPALTGRQYIGPDGLGGIRGNPVVVSSTKASHDAEVQRRLWEESVRLTGVEYPV